MSLYSIVHMFTYLDLVCNMASNMVVLIMNQHCQTFSSSSSISSSCCCCCCGCCLFFAVYVVVVIVVVVAVMLNEYCWLSPYSFT